MAVTPAAGEEMIPNRLLSDESDRVRRVTYDTKERRRLQEDR